MSEGLQSRLLPRFGSIPELYVIGMMLKRDCAHRERVLQLGTEGRFQGFEGKKPKTIEYRLSDAKRISPWYQVGIIHLHWPLRFLSLKYGMLAPIGSMKDAPSFSSPFAFEFLEYEV